MSQEIDQRIVAMQFDNQQFESGVATSIGTLKRLKTALRMDHASDGLNDLSRSVKSFDMSGLASAVDLINQRFSMLGMMGMTVLHRLTNEAINAGHRLLNAIIIDPVKSGFQEYETQINAIQTILANTSSKGTTLDQVNAALDELNHYADMTIYNFTQMTRNIGTFTAAGVDLDTSVAAIKGIANLAAVSGSTSQQASTAMYQLSQAIASGTVKLQDWNSVVNAGMGGQVFQNALMETARLHNIKIDELMKKKGSFRETLSTGWLTSEILTETLKKFTGDLSKEQLIQMGYTEAQADSIYQLGITANDAATKVKTVTQLFDTLGEALQSGWTQSWEWIIGDFEEAKELLTSISDILSEKINESANKRNLLLEGWSKGGGRYMMIGGFREFARGLTEIAGSVQQAWKDIFPDFTVTNLLQFSGKFRKMMIEFHQALSKPRGENGESYLDYIRAAFRGVFSVAGIVVEFVKSVMGKLRSAAGALSPYLGTVLQWLGSFGDSIYSIFQRVRDGESFTVFFDEIIAKIQSLFSGGELGKLNFSVDGIKNFILNLFTSIKDAIGNGEDFWDFAAGFWETVLKSISIGFDTALNLGKGLLSKISIGTIFETVIGVLKAKILALLYNAAKSIGNIGETLKERVGEIGESLTDFVQGILSFKKESVGTTMLKIAGALAILTAAIYVLSKIKTEDLIKSLAVLAILLLGLYGFMRATSKIKRLRTPKGLLGLAVALAILMIPMKTIAGMDWESVGKGIVGIGALLLELGVFIGILNGMKNVRTPKGLISLALALSILMIPMKVISSMSWENVWKGIIGIGALLLELGIFIGIFNGMKHVRTPKGLIGLAVALTILMIPMKIISDMSWDSIGKGIVGIGALLLELGVFISIFNGMKHVKTPKGLISLAVALTILMIPMKTISDMSWDSIGKGIVGIGALLLELGVFIAIFNSMKHVRTPKGLISLAIALSTLMIPMKVISDMSWENLAKGLAGIGALLLELGLFVGAMSKLKGFAKGTIMILALAAFIGVFTIALGLIDGIPSATIAAFGGSLSAMMFAIAGAMRILSKLSMGDIVKGGAALFVGVTAIGGAVALVAEMVGNAVADVAEDLFEGTLSISHISEAGKKIDQKGIEKVKTAAETLATMMGNIVLTDTGGFDAMSDRLVLFGGRLALFNLNVGGIQENAAGNAVKMVNDIATMADTLSGLIDPGNQQNALANTIANVGAAISLYNDNVSGITITPDDTANASNIAAFIGALDEMLPKSDTLGRLTEINQQGEKLGGLNATSFGIVNIATALQRYSTVARNVNPESMNNVTAALGKLAELQENLGPADENPIIRWFTGKKQTLGDFAAALISLGNGLNSFYASMAYVATSGGKVEDVNLDKIGNAVTIVSKLAEVKNQVGTTDGILTWFANSDLASFGQNVETLGAHLASFSNSISGASLNTTKLDSMMTILERLVDAHSRLVFNGMELTDLFTWLIADVESINTLSSALAEVDVSNVSVFSDAILNFSKAASVLSSIPTESVNLSGMTSLMSIFANTSIPEFTLSGTESANAFFAAFITESQNGLANADSISIALIEVLNSKQSGFRQAGNYATRGFAIGIREGRSSAISAAIELASSTLSAVKNRLNEHSPSKETAALGQYFSLGLAKGIDQYSYAAKQSADSMSQEALDAVKAELAALASVSLDDLDTSPVIRPVVDISDVSAGIGAIGSMMQVQPGIQVRGIMSGVAADNLRAVAEENRGTDTSGIMREIQTINSKLDAFSAQLANMKVVLDSGELVGGIQSKVDTALGRNAKMRERS